MTKEKCAILLIADESQAYGKNKSILFDLFLQNERLILRHSFKDYKDTDSDERLQFFKI
jgi:hypothetical protein